MHGLFGKKRTRVMKEAQTILVAEDLPNDVLLLQQAFSKAGLDVPLHFVRDGQEAIDYLNGEQSFADRATHPLPTFRSVASEMLEVE